jgi:hypothetical protein
MGAGAPVAALAHPDIQASRSDAPQHMGSGGSNKAIDEGQPAAWSPCGRSPDGGGRADSPG